VDNLISITGRAEFAPFRWGLGLLSWSKLLYILGNYALFSSSATFVRILHGGTFV
jgi:hypothetical protein